MVLGAVAYTMVFGAVAYTMVFGAVAYTITTFIGPKIGEFRCHTFAP